MIVYNYDADLEVPDTCVRSSLLSWVEMSWTFATPLANPKSPLQQSYIESDRQQGKCMWLNYNNHEFTTRLKVAAHQMMAVTQQDQLDWNNGCSKLCRSDPVLIIVFIKQISTWSTIF